MVLKTIKSKKNKIIIASILSLFLFLILFFATHHIVILPAENNKNHIYIISKDHISLSENIFIADENTNDDVLLKYHMLFNNVEFQTIMGAELKYSELLLCQSNIKQLVLGIEMFKLDNKEFYPSVNTWASQIYNYCKNDEIYKCPYNDSYSYAMNFNLSATNINISNPENFVLIYEIDTSGNIDYRHDGKTNIGFVDGHVKSFKPEEIENLLWK